MNFHAATSSAGRSYFGSRQVVQVCLLTFPALATMASLMARMEKCVPLLQALVQQHNDGTYAGGVEAFNAEIEGVLEQHGMFSEEYLQVDQVGVHPHNREKTMLVPMDCQDLLAKFYENGYNPKKWEALALKIPSIGFGAQEAAQEWRNKNVELVQGSDGLLAPLASPELLDRFTGRGSHGTGSLRLAKIGGKCVHPELQGPDGQVSLSKLPPGTTPCLRCNTS